MCDKKYMCPECSYIEDEQYYCLTCDCEGGNGWLTEEAESVDVDELIEYED